MNLPNKLTLIRIALAFVFLTALVLDFPYSKTAALFIFALAAATDWCDGVIARKYQLITNFGKLMDPLADKILTAAAFVAFIAIPVIHVTAWMVVIVIAREFAVSGMRTLAASQGIILAATRSGKHKLVSQVAFIVLMLVALAFREWNGLFYHVDLNIFDGYLYTTSWWLMFVVMLYALVSGLDFMYKNAHSLFKEM